MIQVGLLNAPGRRAPTVRIGSAVSEDLGTTALYSAMAEGDRFVAEVVESVVSESLTDARTIRYRQEVIADCLAHPELLRSLYELATEATSVRRWALGRWQTPRSKLGLARLPLTELVGHLRKLRETCQNFAGSAGSEAIARLQTELAEQFDERYLTELETCLDALDSENGVLLSAELGPGNKARRLLVHEPIRNSKRSLFGTRNGNSFEATGDFEFPDDPLAAVVEPALDAVAELVSRSADRVTDFFRQLRTETAFYLGCLNLSARLERAGVPMCFPSPAVPEHPEMRCRDLRDVVLCLGHAPVVGNDIEAVGTTLMIVTGANSGGKSTFLRSVGLAQIMMQAGMFVAAEAFRADLRLGLFTHFVRREDRSMEHGRLDDELVRMREISDRLRPGGMLLCNEPFASTNDREATLVVTPILNALVDAGVKIVLVTHLVDFARQRFSEKRNSDRFLRAQRTEHGRRPYRLAPGVPESTSHADDIFFGVFGRRPSGN